MIHRLFYAGPALVDLHEQYAKLRRVDEAAQLVSSSTLIIEAPAEAIWHAIVAFRGWHLWAPAVEMPDVSKLAPDLEFTWKLNGIQIRSKIGIVDEGRELNWTGRFFWFNAVERYVLVRVAASQTQVTLSESLAGPLLPLLYSARKLQINHQRWLTALKRYVEKATIDAFRARSEGGKP